MLIVVFSLLVCPYLFSEPAGTYQPQDRQEEQTPEMKTRSVVGTIVAVDPAENKITVRDQVTGDTDIYIYNEATTFHKNNSDVRISDIATGDEISLEVVSDGDLIVRLNSPSIVPLKD
jgi:hypothetical protein